MYCGVLKVWFLRVSCTLGWWLGNMQILVMYPFYRVGGGELRGEWCEPTSIRLWPHGYESWGNVRPGINHTGYPLPPLTAYSLPSLSVSVNMK